MLLILLINYFEVPETIFWLLLGNTILSAVIFIWAMLAWMITDRTHILAQAQNEGYSLSQADHAALAIYAERDDVFAVHMLALITIGVIAWILAIRVCKLPQDGAL